MLDRDETFNFIPEIVEAIAEFLEEYESLKGPLCSDLERGLVISYALGIMLYDLETIWDCLGKASIFGALHPRAVFEEYVGSDDPAEMSRQAAIEEEIRQRGWLSMSPD